MRRISLALLLVLSLAGGAALHADDPPGSRGLGLAPALDGKTLKEGDRGEDVRALQKKLNAARRRAGLPPIDEDGIFGPKTAEAVKRFQKDAGLPQTGAADSTTLAKLSTPPPSPLGAIDVDRAPRLADSYRRRASTPRGEVALHELPAVEVAAGRSTKPIVFRSGMTIDADGAGDAWRSDPDAQPRTSLRYAGGASLDPTKLNFYVLPGGFSDVHKDVRLGDVAAVIHGGRVAYAIWGDVGPRTSLGEGSIALARALSIPSSPTRGGVESGVTYIVFPGSGTGAPLPQDEIDRRGAALLRAAGGAP